MFLKRSDCVQVVIALVVTPAGFPLAAEVRPGNTSDKTTLADFLEQIADQYGQAQRIWLMDRGIPTEETLQQMRQSDPPVQYLVGTPKGRLGPMNQEPADQPWQSVREHVEVKLHPEDEEGELYVLARSHNRVARERSMRRRQLKKLWQRLHDIRAMKRLKRDALLLKLGAARQQSPSAWRLVEITIPQPRRQVSPDTFSFALRQDKLRQVRQREGRYLLRTNLTDRDPAHHRRAHDRAAPPHPTRRRSATAAPATQIHLAQATRTPPVGESVSEAQPPRFIAEPVMQTF